MSQVLHSSAKITHAIRGELQRSQVSVANLAKRFHDQRFDELIREALRQPDMAARKPLIHETQRIQYDRGKLVIWGFQTTLDAISPQIGGVRPEHSHFPTWRFDRIGLKA